MPKIGFNVDENFRKIAEGASTFRDTVREHAHQPERRATTRPLFYTGFGAIVVGLLIFFMR